MPNRVEATEEIVVNREPDKCFSFLTDLANIGSCIPGCELVNPIDATTAIFKVRLKLGYISKSFELKAKLTEVKPNDRLSFEGVGPDAEITGKVDLVSGANGSTTIKYKIEINPVSVTGKTAISMIGKGLVKSQANEFASCVKKRLEA